MDISNFGTELLQKLVRFNTTNPPGNERECIIYSKLIHLANERIPVKAFEFGIDAIYKLIVGYNNKVC